MILLVSRRISLPSFVLLLCSASLPVAAHAQNSVIQPADIANLRTVAAPQPSPDGRMVIYTVTTPVASGKHRDAHIWIVPADGSSPARPFAYSTAAESAPAWAPDGRHIAFLSDRPNPLTEVEHSPYRFSLAEGTHPADVPSDLDKDKKASADAKDEQLWWIAPDGGEAEPLTNLPGGIRAFKWSPDGTHIAFIRTDTDTPADKARKEAKNDQTNIDSDYHYDRLWIYDLAAHTARLLTAQPLNIDTMDWSPDGRTIVSRVSPTPRIDDYWRVSKVVLFDAASGALTRTLEPVSGYTSPAFSRDGARLAYSRFTKLRITDEHYVRDLATGTDIRIEDKLPGTIYQMLWLGSGSKLLVKAYVKAHTEQVIIDTANWKITPMHGVESPTASEFEATPDGSTITYLGESAAMPDEVFVASTTSLDAPGRRLTTTNPQVAGWSIGTQREISWTNPNDHRTIYGVLVLPPDYKAGTRYKTVVHIHGGPEEAWTVGFNGHWYNYATMLASHGYVVLLPNPRGSDGQGPAFTEANYQDWGGGDYADIMAGVDWLIAQGITDPDRMVVGGWSFGGFMTGWVVTHTDRFKAAMAGAGVLDLFSMVGTTDITPSYPFSYMGPVAANATMYDQHSPVRYVAQCHTPVLILHGEADVRVPLSQSQEFYHQLRFLGKDAVMVTYPREPHIFTEREHQIDSLTRILDWYGSQVK